MSGNLILLPNHHLLWSGDLKGFGILREGRLSLVLDDIDTPALIIHEPVARNNLKSMADQARSHGFWLRPHTKTHKTPYWANVQCQLGAKGLTVAKLGEADVMMEAGFSDLFIAYPLVGLHKRRHLGRLLLEGLNAIISVDSSVAVDELERVGQETGTSIGVLVEVDTGFHRCGLEHGSDVVALAQYVARQQHLRFEGLMCFGGHISRRTDPDEIIRLIAAEDAVMVSVVSACRQAGFDDFIVSVGGTIPSHYMDHITAATELRPGTYIYNDVATVLAHAATWADCAATILATVVSKPTPHRIVVDAGSKALSTDGPIAGGYGYILGHPDLVIGRLSEEHGVIERRDGSPIALQIGDRIQIVPNHVCTAVNLHTAGYLMTGPNTLEPFPIVGRGKLQ